MQLRFWKLSQGGDDFIEQDVLMSIEQRLVYVHSKTRAKGGAAVPQGEDFISAQIGDYFYLTFGNKGVYIIGQFSGPANFFCTRGSGWADRPFRFIRAATAVKSYTGPDKWWAPNNNSTFIRVAGRRVTVVRGEHPVAPLWHSAVPVRSFNRQRRNRLTKRSS